jgi:hypothetical protein
MRTQNSGQIGATNANLPLSQQLRRIAVMIKQNCSISVDRLREVLSYCADTGVFYWKAICCKRMSVGTVAGSVKKNGYVAICVDGNRYPAHRLAWAYVTGQWPAGDIDHINKVPGDNRFANLREATRSQNKQNSDYTHGTSKYRGVYWIKKSKKWGAMIEINDQRIWLGSFNQETQAARAYMEARAKHHPFYVSA